jgi:hypothetical protein
MYVEGRLLKERKRRNASKVEEAQEKSEREGMEKKAEGKAKNKVDWKEFQRRMKGD